MTAIGGLDLSIVTDHIITALEAEDDTARLWNDVDKFTISYSGGSPEYASKSDTCHVSFYLFHVAPNPAHRNTFPLGGPARTTPYHPLALTLHYLLSVHDKDSYRNEQQAMSIALKYLHEHPVMTAPVPHQTYFERFTVTLEPQSPDELGRFWLALAKPLRLSAVYRAEVVFLMPEEPPVRDTKIVLEPNVEVIVDETLGEPWLTSESTQSDLAIVMGTGLDAAHIELRIGGLTFALVADPPGPGQASVISDTELHVRLPSRTRRGRYLLYVAPFSGGPTGTVVLTLEKDVP
jgi:hypothetical protein